VTNNIAFIGLGIMGKPMAHNLHKAGHKLIVHARRAESMLPLQELGCVTCSTIAEATAQADVIFIMVSDTHDVKQVLFAEGGVAQGAKPGSVVVDMSTISPTATRRYAARLAERGIAMLDAPVSGGDVGAINGTLSIMVGGQADVFERVKPLFECMGKNIVHIGDHGAGQVAKACNQIVVGVTIEAVAEALTFARKSGVDVAKVREALMGGFAASRILDIHGKRMLDNNYQPGFKTKLHQKDMNIVMQTAQELGLALPAAALVMQHMNALMGTGDAELDSAAIMKVVERTSGVERE
jgi:2-hydroxy-3-oxopropionate reductase